jgi:hypothetical protein
MKEWKKTKGSVKAGIDAVRLKIFPGLGEPELYFLEDDPGAEMTYGAMVGYHFKLSPDGTISDEPDEDEDDLPDAVRYMIMNVFGIRTKLEADKAMETQLPKHLVFDPTRHYAPTNYLSELIQEKLGNTDDEVADDGKLNGESNGIIWDLS